jgi:hypothetical protein
MTAWVELEQAGKDEYQFECRFKRHSCSVVAYMESGGDYTRGAFELV